MEQIKKQINMMTTIDDRIIVDESTKETTTQQLQQKIKKMKKNKRKTRIKYLLRKGHFPNTNFIHTHFNCAPLLLLQFSMRVKKYQISNTV